MVPVHTLTFTGNPLAETTFEYAAWEAGRTQRARSASFQMGGKGINVAKMLRRLGVQTTALSFLGGASGERCRRWLAERGLDFAGFTTREATREGFVVRCPGRPDTTFLGVDTPADAEAWREAAEWLGAALPVGGAEEGRRLVFALCGSVPGWADETSAVFRGIIDRWIARERPVCVDTYGAPLAWCVERAVSLVKVNADEFRSLFGAEASGEVDDLLSLALERWPVRAWVVTDGAGPVWFAEVGGRPERRNPPRVVEVSATGSGDVMMACLIEALFARGRPLAAAVEEAMPKAAANAAHPGIAEF